MRPLAPVGQPLRVVLSSEASAAEQWAAAELAGTLARMTGRPVGVTNALSDDLAAIELADEKEFGGEEYRIAWDPVRPRLLIRGGRPRGVLYGVIGLLEDHLGCRWYTREVSRIPAIDDPVLPSDLDVRIRPRFEYREVYWTEALDGDWAARNRLNSNAARLAPRHGGRVEYGRFVHTFESILHPDQHFDAHPEWFSMVKGRRIRERTQLCLTNPEVFTQTVTVVRRWIRERPTATIFSVSQNDWGNPCQCLNCRAIDEAEGSHAGSLLAFVNRVAEAIEPEFPGVAIDTLAYQYTRRPPRTIRPRHNVIVRLCSIECCFAHPLDGCDETSNGSFMDDLRGWSRLTSRLYVWDYTTDFAHYLLPFPNLGVLAANVRTLAAHGVAGVFEQGNYSPGGGGELAELRAWVLAKLLWNPALDGSELVREFVREVYGPAAVAAQRYLDLRMEAARRAGNHVRIFDGPWRPDLEPSDLLAWDAVLEEAERSAAGDAALAARVERLRMPVWYAIVARRAGAAGAIATAVRRLSDAARRQKLTHLRESGRSLADELAALDLEVARRPTTPPAGTIRGEDHLFNLVRQKVASRAADPLAEDGVAVRLAGRTKEWAVKWKPEGTETGRLYRIRARIRCEKAGAEGAAFGVGVYDPATRRGLGGREWKAADVPSGAYFEAELPPCAVPPGAYLWIAPRDNEAVVPAIWIDRIDIEAAPL